tara:strand:+ start:494 stop:1849 length:1356 start_codon:yes stop_codon:yes gene_type:complete
MQTTNHHSPQTIAHGLASLGRYGDTYMVHAAEGETVIPAEILLANPKLKADLFHQMQMMGIKNPNRYVVGSALNSLNPVTGQPEFFFKKIFKAFKSVLPIIGHAVANRIAPGLGSLGAGLGELARGGSLKEGLKTIAKTYGTEALSRGIGSFSDPNTKFFDATGDALKRPFQAARSLFTTGPQNVIAQGALGSLFMPESAEQFKALNYPDQFYPQYRTAEEMAPRQADLEAYNKALQPNIPSLGEGDWRETGFTPAVQSNYSYTPDPSLVGEGVEGVDLSSPFVKRPSTPFYKQPALYEVGLPFLGAALLGDDDEGEISGGEAREIGDPEYADYLRYRSAAPGSEREQARRAAGITPAIGARRLAESTGISLQEAQAYLESMYREDANWRNVAGGGEIMGPGTGTSDSIPARLSDGEFVMTADAVRGAGNGSRDLGAARMYDLMSQFEGAR